MMVQAVDWNVVVAGAWNLAILTPQGIARRMFQLEPGTPVEVQIALDGHAPLRVVHTDVMVVPSRSRVLVQPSEPSSAGVVRASKIAANAITSLPDTPFTAAGVNFGFKFDSLPALMVEANRSKLDDRLDKDNIEIASRALKRALAWNQGTLNLEIQEDETVSGALSFNFHRASSVAADLCEWLAQAEQMHDRVLSLLNATLEVTFPMENHE